jgi:hypothetical protein
LALYRLFLGQFQWNFQIIILSCPSTDFPSFVEKYPKIKYAISDWPHRRQLDLCETSFLLLNGSHWNLKFSLPKKLDLRKNKLFHNWPTSFCSRYPNVCDRTKKMDYSLSILGKNAFSEFFSKKTSVLKSWLLGFRKWTSDFEESRMFYFNQKVGRHVCCTCSEFDSLTCTLKSVSCHALNSERFWRILLWKRQNHRIIWKSIWDQNLVWSHDLDMAHNGFNQFIKYSWFPHELVEY